MSGDGPQPLSPRCDDNVRRATGHRFASLDAALPATSATGANPVTATRIALKSLARRILDLGDGTARTHRHPSRPPQLLVTARRQSRVAAQRSRLRHALQHAPAALPARSDLANSVRGEAPCSQAPEWWTSPPRISW